MWKIIILGLLVVGAIVLCFFHADTANRTAELVSAVVMLLFAFGPFLLELYVALKGLSNNIAGAFSLLSVIIYFFIFLGGACFGFWCVNLAFVVFTLLTIFFLGIVTYYLCYSSWKPNGRFGNHLPEHIGSWDLLKGFGGATFAEFAGGLGVLVSIGIYLVYNDDELKAGFWWAAQLAVMISLFSTAAWTQRYVLEKTTHNVAGGNEHTPNTRWRAAPNFLNNVAALATLLAILAPTQDTTDGKIIGNLPGMSQALHGNQWLIFTLLWLLVLFTCLLLAAWPLGKSIQGWPTNPFGQESKVDWQNRDQIKRFLWLTLSFMILTSTGVIWITVSLGRISVVNGWVPWDPRWGLWLAAIAAGLFVFSILGKWMVDPFEDVEPHSQEKMLMIFRDMVLLVCGCLIVFVQSETINLYPNDPLDDPIWSTLYKFVLGMMAYSTLLGMIIGAYKWGSKRNAQNSQNQVPSANQDGIPLGDLVELASRRAR